MEVLVCTAVAHAGLGELDQALKYLELGLQNGFAEFNAIEGSPYVANLRDDPRFPALVDSYRDQ